MSNETMTQEKLLADFKRFLIDHRGMCEGTIANRIFYSRMFLQKRFQRNEISVSEIAPKDIENFFIDISKKYRQASLRTAAEALRALFRFLSLKSLIDKPLASAVPTIPHPRLQHVPEPLTDAQIHRLLDSFNRKYRDGIRGYATALLMLRLGLRSCEVARLSLDDINWREGTVHIRNNKGRRVDTLPLPLDVGDAIADYLKKGRPKTKDRHIFVFHKKAPTGLSPRAVQGPICERFSYFKERVFGQGTHLLRRTAASRLIQSGQSIKNVADVLRHRSMDTTMIYAKINLPMLSEAALSLPEVFQ
jgi:integrase/recombinase XerD